MSFFHDRVIIHVFGLLLRKSAQILAPRVCSLVLFIVHAHNAYTMYIFVIQDTMYMYMCTCMCTLYIALQNDILDINDIFRDLGTMVHDQGELVGE